jgi:hypothetical protein
VCNPGLAEDACGFVEPVAAFRVLVKERGAVVPSDVFALLDLPAELTPAFPYLNAIAATQPRSSPVTVVLT